MGLDRWLAPGAVGEVGACGGKRQALNAVAELAARAYGLDVVKVLDLLLAREAKGSTGVGHGVAVPHGQAAGLDGLRAVFVRLGTPVAFDSVDGRPVDLLFALFAPEGDSTEHLRALAKVSRLLRRPEVREGLRQARTSDAIRALLATEATPSAA